MTDERHNASIRIQALHPQYAEAAAQWASRLGLALEGETEFALQLGDDGLQLVELGDKAPGPVRVDFVEGAAGEGIRVARRMESGMVAINRGVASDPAAPFGGMKESGLGREGGFAGIHEFLETTYLAVDL